MPTEADWKRRVEERKKSEAPNRAQYDSLLQQAVVASDLLTSHPAWDVYLQRLQVQLDEAKATRNDLMNQIAQGPPDDKMRRIIYSIIEVKARIEVLEFCMNLPKEILSHAHDTLDNA